MKLTRPELAMSSASMKRKLVEEAFGLSRDRCALSLLISYALFRGSFSGRFNLRRRK